MQSAAIIRMTAYVVSTVWSLGIAVAGLQLSSGIAKALNLLPLVLVAVFAIWDHWGWKLAWLSKLAARPNLNGTWIGEYDAEWINDQNERHHKRDRCMLVIKQTFTRLSIDLVSPESRSSSVSATIGKRDSGDYDVTYLYQNTPHSLLNRVLNIHPGAAQLTAYGDYPQRLTGQYWTGRLSRGNLEFKRISAHRLGSLDEAKRIADCSEESG